MDNPQNFTASMWQLDQFRCVVNLSILVSDSRYFMPTVAWKDTPEPRRTQQCMTMCDIFDVVIIENDAIVEPPY